MRIININADQVLVEKIDINSILEVVKPLEEIVIQNALHDMTYSIAISSKSLLPARMTTEPGIEQVANFLHTIQIHLRRDKRERKGDGDIIDLLGCYIQAYNNDEPYIELFLNEIFLAAKQDDLHYQWLLTLTLLHELAHAAMDIHNCERYHKLPELVAYTTEYGLWREESMANAVALYIIKAYGQKDFIQYAKDFVKSQPPEYALGGLYENLTFADFCSVLEDKVRGIDQNIQSRWLNYVQDNPTELGLHHMNLYFFGMFQYTDNGVLYSSLGYLINDLIIKAQVHYKKIYGSEMTYAYFQSKVPCISTAIGLSYLPTSVVRNTRVYSVRTTFDGCDYSILCFWNIFDLQNSKDFFQGLNDL